MMSFDLLVYINKDMVWRPLEKFLHFSKGSCTARDHPLLTSDVVILFCKQAWNMTNSSV